MDKVAQKTIIDGIFSFKSSITFRTDESPAEVVRSAMDVNPKTMYYVRGYKLFGANGEYSLEVTYSNTDTKPCKVMVANNMESCIWYMRQYVGGFEKKLVVVANKAVDINYVSDVFFEKHAPFYSNLVSISKNGYHLVGDYNVFEFTFNYKIGRVKLDMMEKEVTAEATRIAKLLFSPGMPAEAKVYLAHNYLAATVEYKNKHNNSLESSYTHSAYGALIKHECVCQGFAEAFKRIMDFAGVRCEIVSGQIASSKEYHAWNIVYIGDSCYHVDVTWDSGRGGPEYKYFCKNDAFVSGSRAWSMDFNPVCSGASDVLKVAKKYVRENKSALVSKGIGKQIIDC